MTALADHPSAVDPVTENLTADEPDARAEPPIDDRPRDLGGRSFDDRASLVAAAVGSLMLAFVMYDTLFGWSGKLAFVVLWWVTFVLLYLAISLIANPVPLVEDRVATVVVTSAAALMGLALLSVVVHVVGKAWPALHHLNFYTDDMAGVRPTDPLTSGGILHALVGSMIQLIIAVAIALPLGLGAAVYMSEVGGKLSQTLRTVVEAMTALPDILAGLFVYTVLILYFHSDRTGFTAAIALTVTAIPIIARSAEVTLRVVPGTLREASAALGASQWQTVRGVVLPTARSGLATAVILATARIVGETAPLLIVSGASTFFNADPFHEPMNSLPLFIFSAVLSGQPNFVTRGYGAAAVLLLFVLILFATARFLARDKQSR
jgi:phosphate transport system permease protein